MDQASRLRLVANCRYRGQPAIQAGAARSRSALLGSLLEDVPVFVPKLSQ